MWQSFPAECLLRRPEDDPQGAAKQVRDRTQEREAGGPRPVDMPLTDAEYLGTDKSTIDIEVAVPANVRFDPGFGETGILRLTEGDVTEVGFLTIYTGSVYRFRDS